MFNNDLDEDFPLNGGSEKLDKLFEENSFPDISFKFTGPKPPITRPKPSQNNIPLKVIFAKTVEAFQMKVSGYKSEGKVGIAIIGNDEHSYYQLYMYRSDEKKVASVEVNFQFAFLVQQYNYASFKDTHNIQWSVHFDKAPDLISFTKEVALARWRSCPNPRPKLVQEAFKGNPDLVANRTDILTVAYTVYSLSADNIPQEEERMSQTKTAPAGTTSWETSLVGACSGSKRFVILPAHLTSLGLVLAEGHHLLLEMVVKEIAPPPSEPSSSPPPSLQSVDRKEEVGKARIAKMGGYALPSLQLSSADNSSERSKAPLSSKLSSNPSSNSVQSATSATRLKEELGSLTEPCDVATSSQFNVLFSEVRTNNSEIRMNITRVTDKVDSLLSKMDLISQINHDVIPGLKKIHSVDGMLNQIIDQNNAIMKLLERSSPASLESTLNEVILLKKRNAELESFLEVSRSTCQILQEKVVDLSEKTVILGSRKSEDCSRCLAGGDRNENGLEEKVKGLQERNYSLLEASDLLQRQNQQLTSKLAWTEAVSSDKDLKIAELEKEVGNLKMRPDSGKQEERGSSTEEIVKSLVNKIYRALKEELKDSVPNRDHLDQTLQKVLRELTRTFLKLEDQLPQSSIKLPVEDSAIREVEELHSPPPGNLPSTPSVRPLPIPRPRRPPQPERSPAPTEDLSRPENIVEEPSQNDAKPAEGTVLQPEISSPPESRRDGGSIPPSSTSSFSPYSSSYYTPLLPTTPPPISDEPSDTDQES